MKKIFISAFLLCISTLGFSQFKWDAGLSVGASNYLGEIGGKNKAGRAFILDLKLSESGSAVGGFLRYKYNSDFFLKGSLGFYRISGDDKLTTNPARRGRNLSFRNDIIEASFVGQYVFYTISDLGKSYRYKNDFKAYAFTGVSGFYSNPKAEYESKWVPLQPLHTEGQGTTPNAPKVYSKFQLAVPAGVGFFFTISKKYRIGWELNWRTTFTDYLDDVSTNYADTKLFTDPVAAKLSNRNDELVYTDNTDLPNRDTYRVHTEGGVSKNPKRGDPKHNDSYLSTTINGSFIIPGKSKFARNKYKTFFKGKKFRKRTIRAKF